MVEKSARPSVKKVKPGEWVILIGTTVVEHNKDISKILKLANKYNKEEITISKEPSAKYCFY
jgi:hypothetical protein